MLVGALFACWFTVRDVFRTGRRVPIDAEEPPNERSTGSFAQRFAPGELNLFDGFMALTRVLTLPIFAVYARALQSRDRGASIRGVFVRWEKHR